MIKFRKARSPRETLNALDEYLANVGAEPVKWLAREVQSWGEFSYAELEAAISDGRLNELIDWQERYAKVVNEHFRPMWLAAIAAAAHKESKGRITISDSDISVRDWLMNHGGRLITQLSEESRKAIMTIILDAQQTHNFDAKAIAREIRPLIGLTTRQVEANAKYRQKIFDQYIKNGASVKVASQRADKAALKYASKQHRYRAETIVNTELAFAYNQGAHIGVMNAINAGYMGRCAMVWTTAGTNRVCPRCLALKGTVVGYTNESGVTLPPIHPRCRCTIEYREIEPPKLTAPQSNGNVGGNKLANELAPNATAVTPSASNPQPLKSIGAKHYAVVQVILANAPNPKAAQVWAKFEDKIKVGALDKTGETYHYKGVLYFDINELAAGDVLSLPYQNLFHEGGHAIDFLNRTGNKYFSEHFKSGAFLKAIESDFVELIESVSKQLRTQSSEQAYRFLCDDLKKNYSRLVRANFSDLLSCYTDNAHNLGAGHKSDYWKKRGDVIKSREAFADFMDAAITNANSYVMLTKYLPRATKIFDEMLSELLK